jgi:hypothetical protein
MDAMAVLPVQPTREQIERLEAGLLDLEAAGHGVVLDTWHHFAEGLVARTIMIRAGTCLTGAAHREEHLNICHGDITVWTEAGMRRLTGHHVLPSMPGAKRVGLAHVDTYWTTVHLNPDNGRNIDAIEDRLTHESGRLQGRRLGLPHRTQESIQ